MNKTILDDRHCGGQRHHAPDLAGVHSRREVNRWHLLPIHRRTGRSLAAEALFLGHFSPWSCGNPGKSWLKEKKHRKISVEISNSWFFGERTNERRRILWVFRCVWNLLQGMISYRYVVIRDISDTTNGDITTQNVQMWLWGVHQEL